MRDGLATGTAPTDPFAALVGGAATTTGRGTAAEATAFGAALQLAERMLDVPSGTDGAALLGPTVTTEVAAAPGSGESATDSTEAASRETPASAVPADAAAMISVLAVAPAPAPISVDASSVTTSVAVEESTPGVMETVPASDSEATNADGAGPALAAPSSPTTGGADAGAPLDRAAAPVRAAAASVPTGSVSTTAPSSDAMPVNGAPSATAAPTGLVPAATRVEASTLSAAAPSAPSSAVPSAPPSVATTAPASPSGAGADRPDNPAGPAAGAPSAPTVAPAASAPTPGVPVVAQPEPPASARSVATQMAPVVVSIAQRPAGSHQVTMTVSPDTLGPVTVRAHIGQNGDVRVELVGATDAGREALRAIVSDLRRDLAAVMPHANLSLTSSSASSTDAGGSDRFAQPGADPGAGGQPGDRRGAGPVVAPGLRIDASSDQRSLPTPALAVAGAGLDTFA